MADQRALEVSGPPAAPRQPRVWLMVGDKVGDNAQIEAIVDGLGWICERKQLRFRERYTRRRPFFRPSLSHVDRGRSDALEPPWPDLVLTIGRRPAMAALWLRQQSGDRTKIVLVGRPHRLLQRFDLIITSALFHLPDHPNVLKLGLPLMRRSEPRIAAAVDAWKEQLLAFKRPLTAVFVGGPEDPFRFDAATARHLLDRASSLPGGDGTLVIVTSRRTPPDVVAALSAHLPSNARMYAWASDQHRNPYAALLGLADRFIVSGDSISMIVEVARLRKPLAIAPLPLRVAPWIRLEQAMGRRFRSAGPGGGLGWRWLKEFFHRRGIAPLARDIPAFHAMLFERGLAVPLGQPFPTRPPIPSDGLALAVSRIRKLFDQDCSADQRPSSGTA